MPRVRATKFLPPTEEEIIAQMHSHVRDSVANRPGVYRMIAKDGEVVYVGKSKQLRSRLLSYFRASYPADKGARIIRQAHSIEWDYEPSEFAALLRELRLIKKFRPRLNVAMKRDIRHYAFIKVSREDASKLTVVRGPSGNDAVVYYGPFIGISRVAVALRELNDVLGLRDCKSSQKMHFADQPDLFPSVSRTPGCIRFEVNKCLGPCVAACSVNEYAKQMQMARQFLDGSSDGPLEILEREMNSASEQMNYELAGVFRDKLARLDSLRDQFKRMRFAVENLSFVYDVPGHAGNDRTYIIRRGLVRQELNTPRSNEEKSALKHLVDEVFSSSESDSSALMTHEIDELMLLASWFRNNPDEVDRAVRWSKAFNL